MANGLCTVNNDISESNYNNYAVDHNLIRRKSLARLSGLFLGGNLCQIYYIRRPITYTLALDVGTVQEACIQQSA